MGLLKPPYRRVCTRVAEVEDSPYGMRMFIQVPLTGNKDLYSVPCAHMNKSKEIKYKWGY